VVVPVAAADADGAPLAPNTPANLWHYRLQWDLEEAQAGWFSREGGPVTEEAVEVVDHDWGAVLKATTTPAEMAAGETVEVQVTVANAGSATWPARVEDGSNEYSVLAATWYQWDGKRANLAEKSLLLPKEVRPGEAAVLKAQVTAPSAPGSYHLGWTLVCGVGKPPLSPAPWHDDMAVAPVLVKGGSYRPLDLSSFVNVAAITTDSYRTRGDFDGEGRSFPAECLLPDLSGARSNVYPSSYYSSSADQPVPFAFPDAGGGVGGALACNDQTIALGGQSAKVVYLLAASTRDERQLEIALIAPGGGEEKCSVAVPLWTKLSPAHRLGAYTPYLRGLSGDEATTQGYLYVLEVRPNNPGLVSAIRLPKDPAVKIVAVTAEGE
jgi:hypothetical protein